MRLGTNSSDEFIHKLNEKNEKIQELFLEKMKKATLKATLDLEPIGHEVDGGSHAPVLAVAAVAVAPDGTSHVSGMVGHPDNLLLLPRNGQHRLEIFCILWGEVVVLGALVFYVLAPVQPNGVGTQVLANDVGHSVRIYFVVMRTCFPSNMPVSSPQPNWKNDWLLISAFLDVLENRLKS